jgi:hypothetical protein
MGATDKQRILKEACDLFGTELVAQEMKVSEALIDGWIRGDVTMPEEELLYLARALIRLATIKR